MSSDLMRPTPRPFEANKRSLLRIQRAIDFFPEPGRRRLGYSLNDCLAMILGVARNDVPIQSCSEKSGTEQSWSWLEEVSGVPPRTCKRILRDYIYLGRGSNASMLSQAEARTGYMIHTETRSQILTVYPRSFQCRYPVRQVDFEEDAELRDILEENSAHISYGGRQEDLPDADEDEVNV